MNQLSQSNGPILFEDVACDLCGNRETEHYLTGKGFQSPENSLSDTSPSDHDWKLVRCTDCSLVYLNPRPTKSYLRTFYSDDYYSYAPSGNRKPFGFKSVIQRWLRSNRLLCNLTLRTRLADRLHDGILERVGWIKPGSVLDIGCGSGGYLDKLARLGWTTYGIDVSPDAVLEAKKRGHQVWLGDLTDLAIEPKCMDVVHMSHVLEHVTAPKQTLIAARQTLRPGGLLIILVPNIDDLWMPLFREYSSGLDLPRHLYHFTPETLKRLVMESGFTVKHIQLCSTPRYILRSLVLSQRNDRIGRNTGSLSDLSCLLSNHLLDSLLPFCRELERLRQGNIILAVAEVAE